MTPMPDRHPRRLVLLIGACLVASGLTSLTYEIVWLRRLQLIFGSTTYSVTTTLAAFMAGLGLGSYLVGRRVDAGRCGLRTYALLELGIAAFALLSLPLLGLAESTYAALQRWLQLGQAAAALLKFGLAFPLLALPAAMMGGTLPALVRALLRSRSLLHREVGWLYGLNTAGAAIGTALAGMVLIEQLGLWRSVLLSALINASAGAAVLWTIRRRRAGAPRERPRPAAEACPSHSAGLQSGLLAHLRRPAVLYCAIAVTISGLLAASYEVVWTRLLSLIIGSSTYSFTLVMSVFLLGIAGGSLIYAASSRRRAPKPADLALTLLLLAIWAWISIGLVPQIPELLIRLAQIPSLSFARLLVFETLFVGAIVLVPTLLLGAALPMATGIIARHSAQVGRDVGGVYLANTLGAIVGSMLAGFVLIPSVGSRATLSAGLFVNLLVAGIGLISFVERPMRRWAGVAVVLLVAVLPAPEWTPQLFNAGLAHRLDQLAAKTPLELRQKLQHSPSRLVYQREGLNATISVQQFRDSLTLLVNGKPDASTGAADMRTQVLAGVVPMLAHRRPRQVAIIGWGSGVTTYVTSFFPEVQRIDAIEIEPAVLQASRYFHRVNGNVERHHNVHVVLDDARSYLLTADSRYDVMISEPSNPWMAGVGALFTSDFYALAKRRLRPGGIFCQWLQLYRLDAKTIALVLRTLLGSFRHLQLWFSGAGDVFLLASDDSIVLSHERIERAYRADGRLPLHMGAYGPGRESTHFYGSFLLDRPQLQQIVRAYGDLINSDDRPVLEYWALRSLNRAVQPHLQSFLRAKQAKLRVLPPVVAPSPPPALALVGMARLLRGSPKLARLVTQWAIARYPKDPSVRLARAKVLVASRQPRRALMLVAEVPELPHLRAEATLVAAGALLNSGAAVEALARLEQMGAARPTARLVYQLDAMIRLKRYEAAWPLAERLLGRHLDRRGDVEAMRVQRYLLYQRVSELIAGSRQYLRAVRLLGSRVEPLDGELDRLTALLFAQRKAGLSRPAARTMDRLRLFGLSNATALRACVQVYRRADEADRADMCHKDLEALVPMPRQQPLWPEAKR